MTKGAIEQFNKAATQLQETEFRRAKTPAEWQRIRAVKKDHAKLFTAVVPMLEAFAAADDTGSRCGVAAKLNPDAIHILRTFAHSMAVLAVRRESPELIAQGLTALAILSEVDDARDLCCCLATLHHSAMRLGIDTRTLFRDVAALTPGPILAAWMRDFPLRTGENRELGAFRMRETVTEEGFDFVPTDAR